jgi:hypothetical protein
MFVGSLRVPDAYVIFLKLLVNFLILSMIFYCYFIHTNGDKYRPCATSIYLAILKVNLSLPYKSLALLATP